MPPRLVRFLAAAAGSPLLLVIFLAVAPANMNSASGARAWSQANTPTPTETPIPEPTDWIRATTYVTPNVTTMRPGALITVSAEIAVTGTCNYPIYDITLRGADPLFAFVDPPSNVIGPPGRTPAVWTLQALQAGVTTFTAAFYGETDCGGYWQWRTTQGESPAVTVTMDVSSSINLPALYKAAVVNVPAAYKVHSFLPPTPTPRPPPPKATDLGTLGGEYSVALDVNDRGQVVGRSTVKGGEASWDRGHAFLWQEGEMKDLGTLGGRYSTALGINDRGQIAGDSEFSAGAEQHGFFWAGGRLIDIGTLGGEASHAVDLNDQGQIAGTSTTPAGDTHCFVWAAGVMTDLGTLGGNYCNALDINNQGQIVGASTTAGAVTIYDTHAFLWENGVMTDLTPDLGGSALAINERGQVIGYRTAPAGSDCGSFCATLWNNGAAIDLEYNGQGLDTLNAINDRGQVVGDGNYHPCPGHCYPYWDVMVWDNGRLINLYVAKYRYPNFPTQLNNQGQIVINAMNSDLIFWQDGEFFASMSGYATAISDVGMVVGGSGGHASLWQIVSTSE